jgi:hypothetical protein
VGSAPVLGHWQTAAALWLYVNPTVQQLTLFTMVVTDPRRNIQFLFRKSQRPRLNGIFTKQAITVLLSVAKIFVFFLFFFVFFCIFGIDLCTFFV